MYRDDPLDDEFELRALVGDDAVDRLEVEGPDGAIGLAVDVLRLLQGWVPDESAAAWFHQPQKRLDERTAIDALVDGDADEVLDAARAYAAAQA